MEKSKKKWTFIVIILLLFATALTIYSRLGEVGKEDKPTTSKGDAIDSFGVVIGTCTYEITSLEDGGSTSKTIFYDPGKNYLGECYSYDGPGASGGAGTGCVGDIATTTSSGTTWTDHTCSVWD